MYFNLEEKKDIAYIVNTYGIAIIILSNINTYTCTFFYLNVNNIDNIYIMQKNLLNTSHTSRHLLTFFVWLSRI